MAVKKPQNKASGGAPEWMVTYGDMVTLLLTFFVLLLAMSEIKKDQRILDFMQAVKEAFGYQGGGQMLPTEDLEIPKNIDFMRLLIVPIHPADLGQTDDEGPIGKQTRVRQARPGEHYQPGGRFQFPELSADLPPHEVDAVIKYAAKLRGYTSLIEVRGHCSRRPVIGTLFADHMELSIQRARTVARILVENGIEPRRLLIVGAATNQPATRNAFDAGEIHRNDVVELLQLDKTIDEFRD